MTRIDPLLIVRDVPYVAPGGGGVRYGTLAVGLSLAGDRLEGPRHHVAWWAGGMPCDAGGHPLTQLVSAPDRRQLAPGLFSEHQLCNKPRHREFRDYHEYVTTYVGLLGTHASQIDPTSTARNRRNGGAIVPGNPFRYADTATARAGTAAAAQRLTGQSVGIVGLGGTGSYVLDLVAKCPVEAIHLFDADTFRQHNAFRCPGAFEAQDLRVEMPKVEVLSRIYSRLHGRVVPHPMRIDAGSARMLDLLDFVFVCVDDGAARGPILDHLAGSGIGYVDVGMGLSMTDDAVVGAVRTTVGTPTTHPAALERIPLVSAQDGPYASNVQIAELNALNAAFAVVAWKRSCGFYVSAGAGDHEVYVVESGAMHRESMKN